MTVSLELKMWSIFTMSSRKLKALASVARSLKGLLAVAPLGVGNFEKMSLTYAAAMGSKEVDGMVVPKAVQGPAAPLLLFAHWVQTTWLNCPFVIPEYGKVAVGFE